MGRPPAIWAYNLLRTKHFHGVSSGNQHPYLLKSRYGKVRQHRDTLGSMRWAHGCLSLPLCVRLAHVTPRDGRQYACTHLLWSDLAPGFGFPEACREAVPNPSGCSICDACRHCAFDPAAYKQVPRSLRRNGLPTKRINGALLMCHEHPAGALVELVKIAKTLSSTNRGR